MNEIMLGAFNLNAWITIVTLIVLIGVLLLTKVRTDAVFMIAIGVLYATGVLDVKEACAGFSSSAVVVTGVLTVVVTGLHYTGVLQWILKNVFGLPNSYPKALLRMMVPVAVLSAFINNTTVTALFGSVVKQWARKLGMASSKLYIPLVYVVLMGGDRLVYAGQIDEIFELKKSHGLAVADHHVFSLSETNRNAHLRTAFVTFGSSLIGKTISGCTIERDYNLILVAVARRGKRIEKAPREVELQAGDTLLFECPRKINAYADTLSSQLQFSDFQEVFKIGSSTIVSSLIMIAMLVLTALNVVSLLQGTVLAALAMLICRCCTIGQAMNSLHWDVLMSMAGSIVLGTAIAKTGIAQSIALGILDLCGTHPIAIMVSICIAAMLVTQLVMNVAVGAMFFPIMYEAAVQVGYEPMTFLIALMIADNTAYATPIGAPANMMVFGPGGYRFGDFMRIGIPLCILEIITGIAAVCVVFPLIPLQ